MSGAVDDVLVVVPARDEERRLPACLAALEEAATRAEDEAGVRVHLIAVLDRCRDASLQVVGAHPRVRAVTSLAGAAGAARRLGVAAGLESLAHPDPVAARVWVASTDADSTVPAEWLLVHARAAADGADLVLGTVRPDAADLPAPLRSQWAAHYAAVEGHRHVHGANLGIRASTYLAAGGFPAARAHEDVALARAAERTGACVVRTALAPVTTSGRLRGRAPEGFASYLAELSDLSGLADLSTSSGRSDRGA